ncbi:MAG: phosphatidylserine decarboxylase family protein [bacterium]
MSVRIPIAREGWPFILPGLLLSFICIMLGAMIPALLFAAVTLCVAAFFRDPERTTLKDDHLILAPADGRVLQIIPVSGQGASPSQQVSIFMSVFNCHVNRVPLSGTVSTCLYNPGKFLPAFREKASLLNEQNTIHIRGSGMDIGVRQIAGLIARRIVCRVTCGDAVTQGSRFGLIKFGSRVDVVIPSSAEVLVAPGQKVKAGLHSIARIRSGNSNFES